MKHQLLTILFSLSVLFTISCKEKIVSTQNSSAEFAPLKMRSAELSKAPEWVKVQDDVDLLFKKIKSDPSDLKSKLLLAQLYMNEARVTGDHPYYYPATLKILDDVLTRDPKSFEALAFKSSVLLSQHHFQEALEVGSKAKAINHNNGFVYGVLCDANVEMGNYDDAVKMSDTMQSVRPGLESYSRASYLREIYGNNKEAIEAMNLAYKAGLPGSEQASWAGNTLGILYENTGDLKRAEELYTLILTQRPTYAFSLFGLARIERSKKNYDKALSLLDKAVKLMPEYSFYEEMADIHAAKGERDKAKQINKKVIDMLNEDEASGHFADMELALVYTKLGKIDKAMSHAVKEYDRRPMNIDVNHVMGWVLYHKGDYKRASEHMKKAMRMGTQNAVLLCRAAIIESAAGNKQEGATLIAKAKAINPYLSDDLLKLTMNN
jgi:tetratricopeptide (TPR) repeat protein